MRGIIAAMEPDWMWVVGGCIALIWGSDLAVGAAIRLASSLGVSRWLIGVTLASVGTSLPEIGTNVTAALASRGGTDASGLAVGNVVGSCLSQITLFLGLTALLATLPLPKVARRRDLPFLLLAAVAMAAACWDLQVEASEAAALVGGYGLYLVIAVLSERRQQSEGAADRPRFRLSDLVAGLGGLVIVILGGDAVVGGGMAVAESAGLSKTTIGLLVGLGTGLPELAIAIRGVAHGAASLSLGNLIGSNITDPLLTLGTGALVHPLTVSPRVMWFDLPVWIGASMCAVLYLRNENRLDRLEGTILLLIFAAYASIRTLWAVG